MSSNECQQEAWTLTEGAIIGDTEDLVRVKDNEHPRGEKRERNE